MKIKSLQLKNFKRFTDLTLQNIPEDAKLVLLIGSNGSGKSSVFDAFEYLANRNGKSYKNAELNFRKNKSEQESIFIETYENDKEDVYNQSLNQNGKLTAESFYGRTSFRQVPRLMRRQLGSMFNISTDDDRAASFIDREERFENDLEHILGKLLKEFFRTDTDKSEIKNGVIDPINNALERIFGLQNGTKLHLLEIIPPLEGKTAEINFKKGEAVFHYNFLSAGEKEVFNILINLIARKDFYQNTIYYFDEIDLHLNTKLQYNFLKEITENWIPENSQLWTASHSLGFIQYAKEYEQAIIFDFDDFDFDLPKALSPLPKDNADVYEIAVSKEFLPQLFQDYDLYFVENKDRAYYAEVNIPYCLFVQENDKRAVYHKAKDGSFKGIIDRDFLTDEDIAQIEKQYSTLKILRLYSIENYLYHPDNLEEHYNNHSTSASYNKSHYIRNLISEKNSVLAELKRKLALIRTEYPFFKEPKFNNKSNQNRFKSSTENFNQVAELESYLNSDIFNDFYKVFPMKDYATQLSERQHISKTDLAKTKWFRQQIESIIK